MSLFERRAPRRLVALLGALCMLAGALATPTAAHGGTDVFQGTEAIYSVAWNPQGTILGVATSSGNITLYDGLTHVKIRSWHAHNGPINEIAFSPDGSRLASVSGAYRNASLETSLKVWSIEGALQMNLSGHRDWITSVVWSPDGAYLATASGVDSHADPTAAYGEVFFWNASVGALVWNASDFPSYPEGLDWSADGRTVASIGHLSDVWLIDLAARDRQMINRSFRDNQGHASHGWAISWAPDSRQLAAGFSRDTDLPPDGLTDFGTVVVFDTGSIDGAGLALHTRAAAVHTKPTQWVDWDSTGTYIASCSGADIVGPDGLPAHDGIIDGGELVIYNNSASSTTLKGMNVFIGGRSWCSSLAWRPGNLTVATGNADGSVRIYVLDEDRDGCWVWDDAAPQNASICAAPQAAASFFEEWGGYLVLASVGAAGVIALAAALRSRSAKAQPGEAARRRRTRRPSR